MTVDTPAKLDVIVTLQDPVGPVVQDVAESVPKLADREIRTFGWLLDVCAVIVEDDLPSGGTWVGLADVVKEPVNWNVADVLCDSPL